MNGKYELTDEQILAAIAAAPKVSPKYAGWVRDQRILCGRAIISADRALRQSNQFAHLGATPEDMAIFDKIANTVLRESPATGDVAMPVIGYARFFPDGLTGLAHTAFAGHQPLVKQSDARAAIAAKDAEISTLTAERDALRKDAVQRRRMTGVEIAEMLDRICVYTGDRETAIVRAVEKWHEMAGAA